MNPGDIASGVPNGWGSRKILWVLPVTGLVTWILLTLLSLGAKLASRVGSGQWAWGSSGSMAVGGSDAATRSRAAAGPRTNVPAFNAVDQASNRTTFVSAERIREDPGASRAKSAA